MWKNKTSLFLVFVLLLSACTGGGEGKGKNNSKGNSNSVNGNTVVKAAPPFSGDSAYASVKQQLAFGPRMPGTEAHRKCGDWIMGELKKYTPAIQLHGGKVKAYDGKEFQVRNIIAAFNPDSEKRIMLSAHYDTRPWADNDPDAANHNKPVPGANDAASGAAVLIELARMFAQKNPGIGVDLFFWDVEDYGAMHSEVPNTFCLGSQDWVKRPHVNGYKAEFGINLDMVGAIGAKFTREGFSTQQAGQQQNMIWNTARELGYGEFFPDLYDSPIIDDHYYVAQGTGIPYVDIIDRIPGGDSFFIHWHTVKDDLPAISAQTLQAVGQTVAEVVYRLGAQPQ